MAGYIQHYPKGFGATVADAPLAKADDIYHYADAGSDNNVFFVDSQTGDDDDDGSRDDPWASMSYAFTQMAAGDVLVVFAGHTETFTSNDGPDSRCWVIGEGEGDDRPQLTIGGVATQFVIDTPCHFHGFIFKQGTRTAPAAAEIDATAAGAKGTRFNYCEFEIGASSATAVLKLQMNVDASWCSNCNFKSTATDLATIQGAVTAVRLMTDCTIEGGEYGFNSTFAAQYGWGNSATGEVRLTAPENTELSILQCDMTEATSKFSGKSNASGDLQYNVFPEGMGLTGHRLLSGNGLYINNANPKIWYVNSETGSDSAGYGASRGRPYASLKYAIDTGGVSGLVIVMSGHEETTTAEITASDAVVIVGEGTGDNRPQFTRGHSGTGITLSAVLGGYILNCRFAQSTAATGNHWITLSAEAGMADQCEWRSGDVAGDGIEITAANCIIDTCTFIADSSTAALAPPAGGAFTASGVDNVTMVNAVFDGGAYGFVDGECADPDCNYITCENLSLLRNVKFLLDIYGYNQATDALIQIGAATGGSGIVTETFS